MNLIEKSALFPYSIESIFDLVADIESYPEFLDGCAGAEVLLKSGSRVTAKLSLARGGMAHAFTTQNELSRPNQIDLTLVDGPFKHLTGRWAFKALGDQGCKASLRLEFEFSRGFSEVAIAKVFDRIALDLVDALVIRANYLFK